MTNALKLPVPNSWYALAFSDELRPGMVLTRRLAGQDVVVYRTHSGQACAIDAFCPHLGAHFGYGGTVEGDDIRCPFHGFRFDTEGRCTATGYGTRVPPKARTRLWRVHEVNGIVFAWYDSRGDGPAWDIPTLNLQRWTPIIHESFELRDHPQETVENGVDIGHFGIVHGYSSVEVHNDLVTDGPYFGVSYAATRPMPVLGRFGAQVRFEFELVIHGLGFSMVKVKVPKYQLQSRLFILATPLDAEHIRLQLGLSMYQLKLGAQIHPLLGLVPGSWLTAVIGRTIHASLIHDARQDFVIWEHKRYVHPPVLAEGDGPIGKYRQWARQFYHTTPVPHAVEPTA